MISDNEQKEILAENLQYYINQTGKEQRQIAFDLDINPPTFNQWVKGKALPSVAMLQRIASYLNVGLSDLAYRQDREAPDNKRMIERFKNYMTEPNLELVRAYDIAPDSIKEAVKKLLDI